ncbi:glycoside hydrolase, family 19 [Deinococcus sp. 6GRE01]|uniref:glycoside hydrolase family 19 protein n=1 Tax=Deinococcus sp. 6GRE01 TaxID=2745873 RepID=UPI001E4F074B|nr:glycoside hydrolase, family 19 [Deinococcus sp. 6GRE01]MCD0155995.1 glycoside hydrolase family 19 protein [Deinococcus sp. 6GRE01]
MITADLIRALVPALTTARAAEVASALAGPAARAGITTRARVAAFVAQLAHESAGFKYLEEIWGPTPAQRRYEGRADLGNTQAGDGYRFRGRGWIQLTGRHNYRTYGGLLNLPLEAQPDLAAQPGTAARIACAYWDQRKLNALADAGDFAGITYLINGGTNGAADREAYHRRALAALPESAPTPRVFLRDMAGNNVVWDGKPAVYNGTRLSLYPDGALQLERTE